ncbi:hypothetical protein OEZ85_012375 [Tetradesmus obliquus]|uniref:VPS37 C-terminal domain-containing protein n=1 Tax=Tetradesmus obliquus TaxID=3088 RepID=A0ABY8TTK1_TETOB|nr:hypothetical protein OEZ85_012375 [Tetradesmus obliquus]
MLADGSLEEMARGLSPEEQESLRVVLQDLQDMQGSWEEEEELSTEEQQLVQQLGSSQIMPDDFSSYLMAMLPEGSGPAELQQLLQSLDPAVLQEIQSVYADLKEFEQTQMDLDQAQERYVQLSSRIASVTARVQGTLAAQQQQQQQQQAQQRPQRRQPLRLWQFMPWALQQQLLAHDVRFVVMSSCCVT